MPKNTTLSGLRPLLDHAQNNGYAVGAFNYCNAETLTAVVEEAEALRAPVILITGPWEIPLLGAGLLAELAKCVAARATVPICLHLDHATDLELVRECIDAGFSSVMFDGSERDYETNVAMTREVVAMAKPLGIAVEGEIGAIGRVGDATPEGACGSRLADPAQAAEFATRTGVDALAVAIGNAHGMYEQLPQLDFPRLAEIRKATPVPLVLHGGSGTPLDQLQAAVSMGISKVNVASEMGKAYLAAIRKAEDETAGKVWYAHAFADGKRDVRAVVRRWMQNLGCAGKA
jgi:ketose-bisphosphate aldolase